MKRAATHGLVVVAAVLGALAGSAPVHATPGAGVTDAVGDVVVVDGGQGTPTGRMVTVADITGVRVRAKATRVHVVVSGVDLPAPSRRVGVAALVEFGDGQFVTTAGSYFSARDKRGMVPRGFRFDRGCNGRGRYSPARDTMAFTFPRRCFGAARKVSDVRVELGGYDPTGRIWSATADVAVTGGFRLPWATPHTNA